MPLTHDTFDVGALARSMKIVAGTFFPQGAGAIVNANNKGKGYTVVRNGVGSYTVTLADTWPFCIAACLSLGLNALADQKLIWNGLTVTGPNPSSSIQCLAVAAASEIAANANNFVSFIMLLSQDSQF